MNEIQELNKLIDIILNYAKEYNIKKFDPFYMREKRTFDVNEYVQVILNQCIVLGATNLKRATNNTEFKVSGDKKFTVGCDLQLSDFRVNVNFDAKLGLPKYRLHPTLKTCCVSLRSCVFYIEFAINGKQKLIKVNKVSLVSKDRVRCVSTGFVWPLNRTVETLIRKNIELFINDNQSELENRAKIAIDESFATTFGHLFADKDFKSVVNTLKVF